MKYRIMAIAIIIFVVITSIIFSRFEFNKNRYHQHLEAEVRPEDVVTTDEFATHLPIIKINIDEPIPEPHLRNNDGSLVLNEYGHTIENNDTIKSKIEYIQNEKKENKLQDTPRFESNAKFRIRGNSSREFDKKGYSIKFMNDDFTKSRDIEIDGMTADSNWVLHGPFMDKTLIRNYICYNLAGQGFDVYSPNVRFCELFLNNKYEGLYLLVEEINYNESGRINVTESNPSSDMTSYILKIDKLSSKEEENIESFFFDTYRRTSNNNSRVSIRYPSDILENQKSYIENKYYKIERTISSESISDKKDGYRKYLDEESFIDYFIFNEFVMNSDILDKSTFLYSDVKNGKLRTAVWDFNNSFGNYIIDEATGDFIMTDRWWYSYLLRDKNFTEKIIKRYKYLRENILSDEYLINYIDETVKYLGPAIDRNFERWSNVMETNFILDPIESNQHGYNESIEYLKYKIIERGKFMDRNIESLRYYSHESQNKR